MSQNRLREKTYLKNLGIPLAKFAPVSSLKELQQASATIGFPCVVKTLEGGYDGKGQVVLQGEKDLDKAAFLVEKVPCILEEWVDFAQEISVIVARNPAGKSHYFRLVKTYIATIFYT